MTEAMLEHSNVTVSDPDRTAKMLGDIFGWRVRWRGDSIRGGLSVHVGGEDSYLAIYRGPTLVAPDPIDGERASYATLGGLNHIGVVVDDLDGAEARVVSAGYEPHSHGDYEPGRRFYFLDEDNIEFEVVSYA